MPPDFRAPSSTYDFDGGAQVEISSNDQKFRGSWYVGTIVCRIFSTKPKEYLVRYDTIFKDEARKIPLEEVLECSHLRPLPPTEKDVTFRLNGEVDAFYKDGWWKGLVLEESKDGKFGVSLSGTNEKLYFDKQKLRLHWEWRNGKWLPEVQGSHESVDIEDRNDDEDQREKSQEVILTTETRSATVCEAFEAGMLVEVSSDEEGFEGSWFPAMIVEPLNNGKYLVEHTALVDGNGLLKEVVGLKFLRPKPPEVEMIDRFSKGEEVDALYNDGWWVGIITNVLVDSKYRVYFKGTEDYMDFDHSDLRLHYDWTDGKWVLPSLGLKSGKRRKMAKSRSSGEAA